MIERETFTTLPESVEIQLVRITIREMGLEIPVGPRRIWKRAEDLHLSLCPPEVSLHLLIDDAAPEKYEEYWIGMKPIITSGGDPRVFGIERDIGRRDLSSYGTCGVWYTYSPLVFVAPDD